MNIDEDEIKDELDEPLVELADEAKRRIADKVIEKSQENLLDDSFGAYDSSISLSGARGLQGSAYVRQKGDRFLAGYSAEHAPYVNYGTDPHFPPPEPIREWVEDRRKSGDLDVSEDEVGNVTFLIQRKIAEEGTPKQPFFTEAVSSVERNVEEIVASVVEDF